VTIFGHEEALLLSPGDRQSHAHGLGRGGAFIQQRGIGQRQSGQIGHHALEVHQGLETSLGDLGLVGRVLGVPAWILQNIALNYRRSETVVVTHADERTAYLVVTGDLSEARERLVLTPGLRQVERLS